MSNEQTPQQIFVTPDHAAQVTCPHCGKGFWHKIGDFLKGTGVDLAEIGIDILVRRRLGR